MKAVHRVVHPGRSFGSRGKYLLLLQDDLEERGDEPSGESESPNLNASEGQVGQDP